MDWSRSLIRFDLFSEKSNAFGKHKKPKKNWSCGVLAVILVVWMEQNKRTFEAYGGAELEEFWERIKFWASLWASTSWEFKHYTLSSIILDWQTGVV